MSPSTTYRRVYVPIQRLYGHLATAIHHPAVTPIPIGPDPELTALVMMEVGMVLEAHCAAHPSSDGRTPPWGNALPPWVQAAETSPLAYPPAS